MVTLQDYRYTIHRLSDLPTSLQEQIISEVAEGHGEVLRYLSEQSLFFFIEYLWNAGRDALDMPYHLEMCEFYEDLIHKKKINIGFRGGYKTTITVGALAWRLLNNSNLTSLIVCDNYELASQRVFEISQNLKNNGLIQLAYSDVLPESFQKDFGNEKILFNRSINSKERTIQCAGITGSSTGGHYDIVLIDDMVNDQNYNSPEIIRKNRLWMANLDSLSVNPHTSEVWIIGNRWGQDDIYGDLLSDKKMGYHAFKYVDVYSDYEKGLTHMPNKYTTEVLEGIKQRTIQLHGLAFFMAQYRGLIVYDEGQTFKPDMLKQRNNTRDGLSVSPTTPHKTGEFYYLIDPAISSAKTADFNVIMVCSVDEQNNWFIEYVDAQKGVQPDYVVQKINELAVVYPPQFIAVEVGGYQAALEYQITTQTNFSVIPLKSQGKANEKELRIKSIAFKWNLGQIYYCDPVDPSLILEQATFFPRGKHDDVIDCLSSMSRIPLDYSEKIGYNNDISYSNSLREPKIETFFSNIPNF